MRITYILLIFLAALGLYAQDYHAMLQRVDDLVSFPENDFQARYTLVQNIPGEGQITTVAAVFRRDSRNTYTMVIEEPTSSRGQGYLKQGETLWVYDPESRQFNSTSSQDRFQNSNARNSDFTRSTLAQDYRVVNATQERLGRYNCWKLELEARSDELSYAFMTVWIDEDGLLRKSEDYSLSRQLLRSSVFPSYTELEGRYVPHKMVFVDHLAGAVIDGSFVPEQTQVTITNPSLTALPDGVFSKAFLERISQ